MDDAAITRTVPAIRNTPYHRQPGPATHTTQQANPNRQPDTVELSPQARQMSQTTNTGSSEPGVRTELVDRVRTQLHEGSYETDDKLDQALEAMIDRLSREEERAEQE